MWKIGWLSCLISNEFQVELKNNNKYLIKKKNSENFKLDFNALTDVQAYFSPFLSNPRTAERRVSLSNKLLLVCSTTQKLSPKALFASGNGNECNSSLVQYVSLLVQI